MRRETAKLKSRMIGRERQWDRGRIEATPWSESGIDVGWNIPKRDTGDNPEEVVVHFSGDPVGDLEH